MVALTGGDLCGGGEWWQGELEDVKTAGGSRWLLGWIGLGVVTPRPECLHREASWGLLGSCAYGLQLHTLWALY